MIGARAVLLLSLLGFSIPALADNSIAIPGAAVARLAIGRSTVVAAWEEQPGLAIAIADINSRTVTRLHLPSSDGSIPAINSRPAFDGRRYLVIWEEIDASRIDVRGAFVSEDGTIGGSFLIAHMLQVEGVNPFPPPFVTWNGTRYLVAWNDVSGWGTGAYINPEGVVGKAFRIVKAAIADAAGHDGGAGMVWSGYTAGQDGGPGVLDLSFGILFGQSLAYETQFAKKNEQIGFGGEFYTSPQLVWNGVNYLAIWTEWSAGRYEDVEVTRISSAGVPLDTTQSGSDGCVAMVGLKLMHDEGTPMVAGLRAAPFGSSFFTMFSHKFPRLTASFVVGANGSVSPYSLLSDSYAAMPYPMSDGRTVLTYTKPNDDALYVVPPNIPPRRRTVMR